VYDAVVVDAPPTGRIVRFLNVTTEVAGLAKVGPIHSQAESVMGLLRSPLTAVHFVTLLEDMPVQETLDGLAELHAAQLPAGAVIVNAVHDEELPDEVLDAAEAGLDPDLLVAGLRQADLPTDTAVAKALAAEALDHARRVALQRAQRARLADAGRPVLELPFVADTSDRTIDLGALYRLADLLCEQGLGRPDKGAA
jgi:anion-transporting  ArsA/GET3 family ATPase